MDKKTFIKNFDLSLQQYLTIDKHRCETFGTLLIGFIGIKTGKSAHIYPFLFSKVEPYAEIIWDIHKKSIKSSDYLGISFVQHYIHYYGTYSPSAPTDINQ